MMHYFFIIKNLSQKDTLQFNSKYNLLKKKYNFVLKKNSLSYNLRISPFLFYNSYNHVII